MMQLNQYKCYGMIISISDTAIIIEISDTVVRISNMVHVCYSNKGVSLLQLLAH